MTDTFDTFDALVGDAAEVEFNPDARTIEETLLVGLFTSPQAAARIIAQSRPNDFSFDLHRRLATQAFPNLGRGLHVDRVTLAAALAFLDDQGEELVKAKEELLDFFDQVTAKAKTDPPAMGKIEAYLTIFADGARKRAAQVLISQAGDALQAGKASPEAAAASVFKAIADLEAAETLAGGQQSEGESLEVWFKALEAQQDQNNDFQGLDTGFNHLNYVANGLTEGLFVLGAAPSTGKTTLAKLIVDQVAELNEDVVCLFISYEQSREELRVKSLSRLSGVENRDIQRRRLDPNSQAWKRIKEAKDEIMKHADKVTIIEGDSSTTPDTIRLLALQERLRTEAGRLLIVVDYLQIVPTDKDFSDIRRQVDFVVGELRRIARDLHATVIAISAIGRGSYDQGKGKMDSFKESGGIEYGADIGAVLVEAKEGDTKGVELVGGISRAWKKVFLDIVKNRNGEKARISLKFFPAVSNFTEGDKETLPDE